MIINNGPIGEKFDALEHIEIKTTENNASYKKLKYVSSNICSVDNTYTDAWYITIKSSGQLRLNKNYKKSIDIACIGGGGGGAGCRQYITNAFISGGGGNGGAVVTATTTIEKNTPYPLTIGAGGTGGYWNEGNLQGDSADQRATSGGTTQFGTNFIVANGGPAAFDDSIRNSQGGINVNDSTVVTNISKNNYDSGISNGGKGGPGIIGTTSNDGNDGGPGQNISWWQPDKTTKFGAGGGGGARLYGATNNGGKGGNSGGGNGGTGYTSANYDDIKGQNAGTYGSGGGGAGESHKTLYGHYAAGGNGYQGVILLRIPKK